jgi:mannose-6-phosphate isomerase-like protein (cupin superfamily)
MASNSIDIPGPELVSSEVSIRGKIRLRSGSRIPFAFLEIFLERRTEMKINSTLKVYNEAELPIAKGVTEGQMQRQLAGDPAHPTERLTVRLATFAVGTHERLHWHMVEAFYYVISGRAEMKDIEGKSYVITAGSVIYAPPGIAGSHSWVVSEPLKLIAVRCTTDQERTFQLDVDPETLKSTVSIEHLEKRSAINFKKSLY